MKKRIGILLGGSLLLLLAAGIFLCSQRSGGGPYQPVEDYCYGDAVWLTSQPAFSDVTPEGCEEAEAIRRCCLDGVLQGVSETEFAPESALTRQMAAQALRVMAGESRSQDAAHAVDWAREQGLLDPADGDALTPERPVTYGQLLTMLYRLFLLRGNDPVQRGESTAMPQKPESAALSGEALLWYSCYGPEESAGMALWDLEHELTRGEAAVLLSWFRDTWDLTEFRIESSAPVTLSNAREQTLRLDGDSAPAGTMRVIDARWIPEVGGQGRDIYIVTVERSESFRAAMNRAGSQVVRDNGADGRLSVSGGCLEDVTFWNDKVTVEDDNLFGGYFCIGKTVPRQTADRLGYTQWAFYNDGRGQYGRAEICVQFDGAVAEAASGYPRWSTVVQQTRSREYHQAEFQLSDGRSTVTYLPDGGENGQYVMVR